MQRRLLMTFLVNVVRNMIDYTKKLTKYVGLIGEVCALIIGTLQKNPMTTTILLIGSMYSKYDSLKNKLLNVPRQASC